jgi:glutathione peroxidase
LSEYRGKVLVITNLASFWGLTPMHYFGYNALKQKFAGKQFEVLGFPCDQFNLVS